ncbi:AAA family ATPase, partial [Gemmatimonadales bacterium]|nr:AAA family ATPase [Gemmatimonadales bacterium]
GALTKAVRRRPYSVVLLDEVEKAHPDVFNILLQVLDEGHLTDNYGRVIDFKNTVLIMTSNLGAREISKGGALGFQAVGLESSYQIMKDKVAKEIERAFNPEFLNRVDDTIVFHPLSKENISEIIHILMRDVHKRLAEEEIKLTLTDAAIEFLVNEGYDEKFGARPLKRAIQRHLEDLLSEGILQAEFSSGDELEVDVNPEGERLLLRAESATKT